MLPWKANNSISPQTNLNVVIEGDVGIILYIFSVNYFSDIRGNRLKINVREITQQKSRGSTICKQNKSIPEANMMNEDERWREMLERGIAKDAAKYKY